MKYDFYSGENAKKVTYRGFTYLGKGGLGKIKFEKIDGKKVYYLVDYFHEYDRISPKTSDKSKFKEAKMEDWKYKGEQWRTERNYITKQKPKKESIFNTKIEFPKKNTFMGHVEIRFGKNDFMFFSELNESNIIKDLQLRDGDKLKVIFTKIKKETK